MARVFVDIDISDARVAKQGTGIIRRKHSSLTRQIANQARADVPVLTGNLGRTIREDRQHVEPLYVSGGVSAGGIPPVDYARYVHDGTRPHRINAVRAKALHFYWQGREVFTKSVWHPGTRSRPFLRNAGARVVARDPEIELL